MSLIFAWIVGFILVFYPFLMTLYFKASGGYKFVTGLLCLLSFFGMGIPTIIAFIIACFGVGFVNSVKSIGAAIFLVAVTFILMAAELTAIIALIGSTL